MRIVGGSLRGRRLLAPADQRIRPTGERIREALFNILAHRQPALPLDVDVVDGFAGTGALGLEALSRGASRVAFLESDAAALALIERNLAALGGNAAAVVMARDVTRPGLAPFAAQLLLMDPPYLKELAAPALSALAGQGWLKPGAICVIELARKDPLVPPESFQMFDERSYGATKLVFLEYCADKD